MSRKEDKCAEFTLEDVEALKLAWDWMDDEGCRWDCADEPQPNVGCHCGRITAQLAIESVLHTAGIMD